MSGKRNVFLSLVGYAYRGLTICEAHAKERVRRMTIPRSGGGRLTSYCRTKYNDKYSRTHGVIVLFREVCALVRRSVLTGYNPK